MMWQYGTGISSRGRRGRRDESRRGGLIARTVSGLLKASRSDRVGARATQRPDPWSGGAESGAIAVEFAFLAPILVLMLVGIMQFGAIFFVQSHMVSVARETARYVAVGEMTAAQAAVDAKGKLLNWTGGFTVLVTEPAGDVAVNISIPLRDAAILDIWGLFSDKSLQASIIMRKET